MSPIKRGSSDVAAIFRGGTAVQAVYRGGTQIWGGTTITPATVRAVSTSAPDYGSSVPINKPAGTVEGDLLVLFTYGDYGSATNISPPSGFTQLAEEDLGNNLSKLNISYKVATASEPSSYSVPMDSGADSTLTMLAVQDWSGDTSQLRAATAPSPSSSTSHIAPAVTPSTEHGLLIASTEHPSSSSGRTWAWTPPSGYTERSDITSIGAYSSSTTATRQWESTSTAPQVSFALSTTASAAQGVGGHVFIPSKVTASGGTPPPEPATPPTVRSVSSLAESGGAGNPRDINRPSPAPVAGDLLIFVQMMSSGSASEADTGMTPPAGFTTLAQHTITAASNVEASIRLSYKVATASEPATYQYQTPTGYSNRGDMICVKDWDPAASPVVAYNVTGITPTNSGSNPDTYALPSVTPQNSNGLLITTIGTRRTTASASHGFNWDWATSGMTELTDIVANNLVTMSTATQDWPTADPASGKTTKLNRSDAEDRAAVVATILVPGVGQAATGPTGGDYTGGSGGAPADVTGLTHDNGVKTSTYHLFAGGLDWTKNVGLLVYTDGSGEYGYQPAQISSQSPYVLYGASGMIAVAKKHNMILLCPMAPGDGCTDNDGVCWYMNSFDGTTQAQKTAWSKSLVDYIMGRYNIDKQRVVLSGYSSGAQWTTQYFGPLHASSVMTDGLMLPISYGGQPIATPNYPTAFKAAVPVVWDVGANDPGYQSDGIYDVQSGYDWYTSNGFAATDLIVVPNKAHDRYNTTTMVGEFGGIVDREITKWVKPA